MKKKLTQERLKELLRYDPDTGLFINISQRSNNAKINSVAGHKTKQGYISIRVDTRSFLAQRLACLYMKGYFPENDMDHIDRVKDNNKWSNLREATRQCNMRNCGIRRTNTSGVTGVSYSRQHGKYVSHITINSKYIFLGYNSDKIKASRARWEAEKKYGFPNCCTTSTAYNYLKETGCLK